MTPTRTAGFTGSWRPLTSSACLRTTPRGVRTPQQPETAGPGIETPLLGAAPHQGLPSACTGHTPPTPRPISPTGSEGSTGRTLSSPRFPGGGHMWLPAAPPDHSAGRSSETRSPAAGTVTMTLLPLSPAQGCAPLSCGLRGSEAPPAPSRRVPGSTGGPVLTVPAGPAVAQDFSSDSATYLSANVKGSNFYQNYSSYFCLFFFFCVKGAF